MTPPNQAFALRHAHVGRVQARRGNPCLHVSPKDFTELVTKEPHIKRVELDNRIHRPSDL
jgi:hypothetical protein